MQPQDYDQPPAQAGNGMQPPAAPQPLQPLNTPAPYAPEPPVLPAPTPMPPTPGPMPTPQGITPNPYNGDGDDETRGGNSAKRMWLIIAGIVFGIIVILVVTLIIMASSGKDKAIAPQAQQTAADAKDAAIASTNPQFFYTRLVTATQNQEVIYVDAVTGKQTKQTIKLNDSFAPGSPFTALSLSSVDANPSVQITSDGKVLAYATVRYEGAASGGTTDAQPGVEANSFTITAGSRTGTRQSIVGGKNANQILDWKLSADGKVVYYLAVPAAAPGEKIDAAEATLHSVNVNTGQSKTLGTVQSPSSRLHSKLFEVTKDKTVRFYTAMPDGIYQTSYDIATEDIAYDLIVGQSQYTSGGFGDLSPDGQHLMYTGSDNSKVVSYRIGTKDGEVQTIFDPSDKRMAYTPVAWSADSKKLTYVTQPYNADGQAQQDFKYQMISYDITTNQQTKLAETTAPGIVSAGTTAAGYGRPTWSTDKKHIAYTQGQKLYMYDVVKGKTQAAPVISLDGPLNNSDTTTGWIQIKPAP